MRPVVMVKDELTASGYPTIDERRLEVDVGSDDMGPGTLLDDRYELGESVGRGGMGAVHLGRDHRLGRDVAIKLLHPQESVSAELRAMFRREAEIMARLRHPNVVEVFDTGGWDARPYLVMPFHRGTDLGSWARHLGGPPVAVDVAIGILGQACSGVAAMHEAGVLHGDIKPRNILVSDALEVILVDLGLSRPIESVQDPEALGGTPGFVAPEFIRRDSVPAELVHKADVYALGVTAYWLLTGQTPAGTGDVIDILTRQVEGEIEAPSERRPDLDPAFDMPVLDALRDDPSLRPEVAELRDGLLAARQHCSRRHPPFIVVVDDDPEALRFEESIARSAVARAEVVGLDDPHAALSLVQSRPPDLVITDLQMPTLNGIELTALLQGNPSTASVPVIVTTEVGGADEWKLLHTLGAECLLVKPLRPEMLGDAIRRVMQRVSLGT